MFLSLYYPHCNEHTTIVENIKEDTKGGESYVTFPLLAKLYQLHS